MGVIKSKERERRKLSCFSTSSWYHERLESSFKKVVGERKRKENTRYRREKMNNTGEQKRTNNVKQRITAKHKPRNDFLTQ